MLYQIVPLARPNDHCFRFSLEISLTVYEEIVTGIWIIRTIKITPHAQANVAVIIQFLVRAPGPRTQCLYGRIRGHNIMLVEIVNVRVKIKTINVLSTIIRSCRTSTYSFTQSIRGFSVLTTHKYILKHVRFTRN